MANSAFNHSPTITVPGSSTNTALVRWSSTGADTFLDSTILVGATTMGLAADPDLLTFGNGTIAITGAITGVTTLTASGAVTGGTLAGTVSTATQNSITTMTGLTTVGTVGTGVWNGTAIITTYGGTGLASYTAGDMFYYVSGTTLTKLAKGTADQVLTMNDGASAPGWEDAAGGGTTVNGDTDNGIISWITSSNEFQVESGLMWDATTLTIGSNYTIDDTNGFRGLVGTAQFNSISSMAFNIDSDNNQSSRTFTFYDGALNQGGTILMQLVDTGDLYVKGKTGIGKTDPAWRLEVVDGTTSAAVLRIEHTATSNYSRLVDMKMVTDFNDTSSFIFMFTGASTQRMFCYSNGNFVNSNNSYGSTSDERVKDNIQDANSQWNDIKALRVRNFIKKDNPTHTQIGLIGQEVELIAPGLIEYTRPGDFEMEHCGFGHQDEDGTWVPNIDEEGNEDLVKGMKYSVLHMKAIKALQEAMERIEILEVEVNALKA